MAIDIEKNARFEAAHQAYRIIEAYGVTDGSAVLRGRFVATMKAIAAVEGWAVVRELIMQHGERPFVPTHGRKLELAVDNTECVA